ncbi:aldo/keto reductase [Acetobacter oeni]|uniref:NADP-dependent aryl-alcohol dehydrogenase n=1 Tax=Acetobacter oeni TaxID=304077 RepID=A0A511XHI2_9PROT|nr:aldo/keto reductase [Acetobacter oeni]MBB3881251.1 aryl-alcohol dehydrogenase-like predicted oxidoreductase [Acetobacter oeni]NHO18126.1 aldo/keto reductase [Acetobacter oeni]GBR08211.1 aldo/keto reductase [Acetobacter oeni LMG 21952]GEN62404.1 NADP-dependent aryl-alcohol dehydrogenase [Acetobacter oeni]
MKKRALGKTGFDIAPIVFGGNVFGWTIDKKTGFEVLDAFVANGFNAIDTADVYSVWVPGNKGGESETIIGQWLKARPGTRDRVKIFTKVGMDMKQPGKNGLSEKYILQEVDDSLSRLGIERIDLYFSHRFDPDVPQEETLGAYDKLLKAGKIRAIGASNFNATQLEDALTIARKNSLPVYQVLQPEYNLCDREAYDGALRDLCLREGLGVVPYYSLASGFLSGKYRDKDDLAGSKRGTKVESYLNPRGIKILEALDKVADRHNAKDAEVALAWLIERKGVTAPIASATKVSQVESFAKAASLSLSAEDMEILEQAGAVAA